MERRSGSAIGDCWKKEKAIGEIAIGGTAIGKIAGWWGGAIGVGRTSLEL
jgi:hypothetical protein